MWHHLAPSGTVWLPWGAIWRRMAAVWRHLAPSGAPTGMAAVWRHLASDGAVCQVAGLLLGRWWAGAGLLLGSPLGQALVQALGQALGNTKACTAWYDCILSEVRLTEWTLSSVEERLSRVMIREVEGSNLSESTCSCDTDGDRAPRLRSRGPRDAILQGNRCILGVPRYLTPHDFVFGARFHESECSKDSKDSNP